VSTGDKLAFHSVTMHTLRLEIWIGKSRKLYLGKSSQARQDINLAAHGTAARHGTPGDRQGSATTHHPDDLWLR